MKILRTSHRISRVDTPFMRGTHPAFYRSGQWAKIEKVLFVTPVGGEERLCYRIVFVDGAVDNCPVYDPVAGYEFTSKTPEGWPT